MLLGLRQFWQVLKELFFKLGLRQLCGWYLELQSNGQTEIRFSRLDFARFP
jgi:hypothetical protein